ncbi:4Fe-4S dicluster domain-containing protein [Geothermobacter ehrlichii]|uniref:4Fe-4S dicluster domain-containing protein n=1 Tax=Geothermobacter ehrlichii TaxID=213224 RepID=UPI0011E66662
MNIAEEKIVFTAFNPDIKAHIVLNDEICISKCKERYCTFVCPASCFVYEEESSKVVFSFEGCLECGTCRISCEEGALDWNHPEGGYGVVFRLG